MSPELDARLCGARAGPPDCARRYGAKLRVWVRGADAPIEETLHDVITDSDARLAPALGVKATARAAYVAVDDARVLRRIIPKAGG